MKPRIFVSAVSRELKTARQLVANTLLALGYEPVWQDIFETSSEDIRPMLRRQIDSCSAVLQIVGDAYGAEPPTPDETYGRVSYTQYEALFAKSRGRKVYYLIAQDDMPRDATPATIDVPREDTDAGRADVEERRRIQGNYRASVQSTEHIFYPVQSHPEAELSVRRLKQDMDKLRRGFRYWMLGITVAIVLIAGGIGILQHQQRSEHRRQVKERIAQQLERENQDRERAQQEKERQAAEAARKEAQKVVDVHRTQADRFLHILLTDKDITPEAARQRAIKELPAMVDLPLEEVLAIIDRKLPLSTPENPFTPLERARAALSQGKFDDVIEAVDAERSDGRELAMLEGTAALAKFRESPKREWNERAVAAFGRALALSAAGSEDWADAANSSAMVLCELSRYEEAESLLVGALRIRERQHGGKSPLVAVVLNNLAQLLQATNRLAEAEPLLRRALTILEQYYGADQFVVAGSLNNLGQLLYSLNRLVEAESFFRRALDIDEQSYGANHPNVARDLNNLAQLLRATNRLAEAEPMMRRALTIDEQSYGVEHPSVAISLSNLAMLLHDTNRTAEAQPIIRRALLIDEQSYGANHPNVARDLNNLAQLLMDTNRVAEAEPLMRRAVAIDEQFFGTEHSNVARDLNNLAQLLTATNRLAEAEPLMRRALAIDEQSYGAEHPKVAIGLNNLAMLLQATNRLAEAEPLMRRALAIDEQSYGSNHPNVARDLNNLALLLEDTDRLAEAEPLFRRALAIDRRSYGAEHPNVGNSFNNLALLLKATNRLAESEAFYRRALAINEKSYGAEHPDVALNLNNLALLLMDTDRLAEAEPLMRRSLAIFAEFERKTGFRHGNLITIDRNYRALLIGLKLGEDEIASRTIEALATEGPLSSIVPEVELLLGAEKPVEDVLAGLDKQYKAEGKNAIYFLPPNESMSPQLDELLLPNPDAFVAEGVTAYRARNYPMAIACCDESLKSLPELADQLANAFNPWMNRAAARRELGEFETARDELNQLIIETMENVAIPVSARGRARYHLALTEWRLGNLHTASQAAEESLQIYGDDADSADLKIQSQQLLADLTENKQLPLIEKRDYSAELGQARAQLQARSELVRLPAEQPTVALLDQMLGPAKSTPEVFEELDRQYREQNKPAIWFLPLDDPISPHLDELLGPIEKSESALE